MRSYSLKNHPERGHVTVGYMNDEFLTAAPSHASGQWVGHTLTITIPNRADAPELVEDVQHALFAADLHLEKVEAGIGGASGHLQTVFLVTDPQAKQDVAPQDEAVAVPEKPKWYNWRKPTTDVQKVDVAQQSRKAAEADLLEKIDAAMATLDYVDPIAERFTTMRRAVGGR